MHSPNVTVRKRVLRSPVRTFSCSCGRTFPSKGKLVRHLKRGR